MRTEATRAEEEEARAVEEAQRCCEEEAAECGREVAASQEEAEHLRAELERLEIEEDLDDSTAASPHDAAAAVSMQEVWALEAQVQSTTQRVRALRSTLETQPQLLKEDMMLLRHRRSAHELLVAERAELQAALAQRPLPPRLGASARAERPPGGSVVPMNPAGGAEYLAPQLAAGQIGELSALAGCPTRVQAAWCASRAKLRTMLEDQLQASHSMVGSLRREVDEEERTLAGLRRCGPESGGRSRD